jgi:ATP-dependent RNA helicase DHX37/DHR1
VAQELSSNLGDIVGYQVRYDKKVGANTKLKFMTDGILMRELQEDALLRKYSVIVLDEVHERNLNTDVILGFLTRIIPLRAKLAASPDSGVEELKLLIMSATLSSKEFVENKRLFSKQPPVISVPAKRYPVTVHFSRKTELHSYLHVAYKKVCAIHRKLPNGGVLVFVTGQREVQYFTKRLQKGLCRKKTEAAANNKNKNKNKENDENDKEKRGNGAAAAESNEEEGQEWLNPFDGDAAEDFSSSEEDESEGEEGRGADEGEGSDVESEEENKEELPGTLVALNGTTQSQEEEEKKDGASLDALVIPLYAKLGPELQERAFSKPPPNCRLIIIATNVAETSITIPGIRYVVDAGRSKQKTHKSVDSGLTQFEVNWISKSSATQRAGRAGRTGPGHCYRLFSSAFYNDKFPQFSVPDIKNTPLEAVVLQLKSIGVDKSESFPFPTQPNPDSLSKAERCLRLLNMVSSESGQINGLGSFLSKFPINPRHARMLVASVMLCNSPRLLGKCLQVAISVAAILSFEDPVNHQETGESNKKHANSKKGKQEKHKQQQQQQDPDDILSAGNLRSTAQRYGGDVFATLTILRAYEEQAESDPSRLYTFCNKNRLHVTVIREIVQLKRQLASICASRVSSSSQEEEYSDLQEFSVLRKAVNDAGDQKGLQGVTPKPNAQVATILQHAICVGWADRVARRITVREMVEEREGRNQIRATHKMKKRYQTLFGDSLVSLRKKSAISHNRPEFVVYRDLIQGRTNTYMECVTEVHPSWLSDILKPISTFSSPLEEPEPFYDAASDKCFCWVHPSVGRHDWSLPICKIEAHDKAIRCRAFLAALLSGKVFPQLSASLEVPASWDHHPAVVLATKSLEKYNVSTKKAFERALNLKKGFLFDELKLMAKKNQREGFAKFWDSYA